ncbi:MAG: methyl-accepting chemotaxis protein, partial [Gammaproteobacteria bacterium]
GIEQVNLSIIEMDSMTQQNAALVEEAAAAAQSLQDQANELAHVVSIFKLVEGEERHVMSEPVIADVAPVAPVAAPVAATVPAVVPKKAARPALKRPAAQAEAAAPAKPRKVAAAAAADEWEEF